MPQSYVNLAAFLLQANGAAPGADELTAATSVTIGSVATGTMSEAFRAALASAAPAAADRRRGPHRYQRRGRGRELPARHRRHAATRLPADDWLMIRGNYQAWNYSELDQITRDNVEDLTLEWIWSMTDGGWNEPAPVVHDGVLYLNNMGNIIQALDAATGELIWENRVGPVVPTGDAMRGLAIYGDKLFIATTDARLVALDAQSGQIAWETVIGDRTEGAFGTSSGPIVIGGKVLQGLGDCTLFRNEKCFISAYDANDGRQLWKFATVATTGTPGGDTWGERRRRVPRRRRHLDHRQLRPRSRHDLLGRRASEAVGAREPRQLGARPRALHEHDARAEPERRQLEVVLPARARRGARPRRGLRARVDRRRRREGAVHDRQARHPLEARSRERPVHRPQGDHVSERLRPHRPRDRRAALPRRHRRRQGRRMGAGMPEHRRRPQLAGDDAPRADVAPDHSA